MNTYQRWGARAGVPVLVLLATWTFRAELTAWFALESDSTTMAMTDMGTDGGGGAGSDPTSQPASQPVAQPTSQPTNQSAGQPASQPSSQPTSQPSSQPTSQPMAAGPGFIRLTPYQRQLIGVTTARVDRRPLQATLRTVGHVDYDETRLSDVNIKVRGWIEQLHADFTGGAVERGQPLFTLYSPELVSTQQELLLAQGTLRSMQAQVVGDPVAGEALERQRALVDAVRRRLQLWDIDDAQLDRLAGASEAHGTVTVHAPASGIVIDKMAVEGMYVTPGMRLYRIAPVDTVWVQADLYEYEVSRVRKGQSAVVELPYEPGRTYRGTVEFLYPYLDGRSRTTRVRLRVPNPDGVLRPDMFAHVSIEVEGGERLAVPEQAVLRSGRRQVVFVDLGEGRLQPRQVEVGMRFGEYYQVLAGLSEGEQVVTSAQFLLDSESKLKNVMAAMSTGNE